MPYELTGDYRDRGYDAAGISEAEDGLVTVEEAQANLDQLEAYEAAVTPSQADLEYAWAATRADSTDMDGS